MNLKSTVKKLFTMPLSVLDKYTSPLPWLGKGEAEKEPLLVIGGIARSGNHLLRGLLDGHPKLAVPPDEDYFIRTLTRHRMNQFKGWVTAKEEAPLFYRKMQKNDFFTRLNSGGGVNSDNDEPLLDLEKYSGYVRENHQRFSFENPFRAHFGALRKSLLINSNEPELLKVYFCVLNPLFNDINNIGSSLARYYDVKAVFLFRNPLAVYCSAKSRLYFDGGNIKVFCRAMNKYYRDVVSFERKNRGEVFYLSFESLINETVPLMQRLASFINIPYHDILSRVTQNGKDIKSNSSFEGKEGIDHQALYRYREKLTQEEITYIKDNCPQPSEINYS